MDNPEASNMDKFTVHARVRATLALLKQTFDDFEPETDIPSRVNQSTLVFVRP